MNPDFLIDVRHQNIFELYEDWSWLVKSSDLTKPLFMTKFGDLFFQKKQGVFKKGENIWLLDVVEATVKEYAKDLTELEVKLSNLHLQQTFLFSELVKGMTAQGHVLSPSTLYSFKVPLHLGGKAEIANVEVSDKSVALSIAGQIEGQIKNLAPGTKISGVGISQEIQNRS